MNYDFIKDILSIMIFGVYPIEFNYYNEFLNIYSSFIFINFKN